MKWYWRALIAVPVMAAVLAGIYVFGFRNLQVPGVGASIVLFLLLTIGALHLLAPARWVLLWSLAFAPLTIVGMIAGWTLALFLGEIMLYGHPEEPVPVLLVIAQYAALSLTLPVPMALAAGIATWLYRGPREEASDEPAARLVRAASRARGLPIILTVLPFALAFIAVIVMSW